MMLHTYYPQPMSLPSINFLHLTVAEMWPGQGFILFIYLRFYVAFNTVQVISRRVVGMAEETSTFSTSGFLYCKLPTNGKQLPAFPLEAMPGIEPLDRLICLSANF